MTISKNECLSVYSEILKNSDKKWQSGIKLADNKDFGGAISLAIISNEELIKALIVFFDGHAFKFRRVKGINALFKNHQLRYLIAYTMFAIGSLAEDIVRLVKELRKEPTLIDKIIHTFTNDRAQFESWIFEYLQHKLNTLGKEFDWFSRIDMFRKDGFYCDFRDYLKNPVEITELDYQHAFIRLNLVRNLGMSLIDSINDQNPVLSEALNSLKSNFIKYDYYTKVSTLLAVLKNKWDNPFEIIKSYILENVDTKDMISILNTNSTENKSIDDNCQHKQ
jgi:AbiV family abortive infection protein